MSLLGDLNDWLTGTITILFALLLRAVRVKQ
jgi:hypothetical protein